MTFNKAKPADDDLISDSAADIRANFAAIETGTPNFFQDKVVLKERAANPSAVADRHQLFTKEVGSQSELFARNDLSGDGVIQMTDSGNLGSASTTIWFESFSHDSGTTTYNENNFVTAWGAFQSDGSDLDAAAVVGLSASKDSTGLYTVTFDTALSSANYLAVVTPSSTSSNGRSAVIHTLTSSTFKVEIRRVSDASKADSAFDVLVLGGR